MLGEGFPTRASQGLPPSELKQMSVFLGKAESPGERPGAPRNQGTFVNIVSPCDEESELDWLEGNRKSGRRAKPEVKASKLRKGECQNTRPQHC